MPKKFAGENSKAVAARARKQAAKDVEIARKQQEQEDALWKDDDKHVQRKQQRKEERDKKKQEQLEKKAEAKALLQEEAEKIQIVRKQPLAKVTRAQIEAENEKRQQAALAAGGKKQPETHLEKPLEENINRLQVEGLEARTIEDAICALSTKEAPVDKHPERRMKAAFSAFEEVHMPRLKAENPNLRLSQVKQLLRKEWLKSPENPMNQLHQKE